MGERSCVSRLGQCLGFLLLLPFGLAFFAIGLVLWLVFTLTGLGPLIHCCLNQRDRRLLDGCVAPAPGAPVELWPLPDQSRRLAVRWSKGRDPALPPICIPNGLGATLITIGSLHDLLEAKGYAVLSYDRSGVGLSDKLPSGTPHATAAEVVAEMKAVMDYHVPIGGKRPWILIGPSMGSIVGQCFAAVHPDDVTGFLNVDGLPYPFAAHTEQFMSAGKYYKIAAAISCTGLLRFFLGLAGSKMKELSTPTFPVPVVRAQMNEANFYSSLAREMGTMMDCCAFALHHWGKSFDLAALPEADRATLVNAQPAMCGDVAKEGEAASDLARPLLVGEVPWIELPRAKVEKGSDWTPEPVAKALVARLLAESGQPLPALPKLWPSLVVRVLTARDYDFGPASSFYTKEMQDLSAAEHSLHSLLARDGRHIVFPRRNHGNMFFGVEKFIAAQADEIANVLAAQKSSPI